MGANFRRDQFFSGIVGFYSQEEESKIGPKREEEDCSYECKVSPRFPSLPEDAPGIHCLSHPEAHGATAFTEPECSRIFRG